MSSPKKQKFFICQYCNESFKPCVGSAKKYCSTDCYHKSTRTKLITHMCQYCNKIFTTRGNHIYKFCSVYCRSKSKVIRKDANPPRNFICKYCGGTFERILRPSNKPYQFCSPTCRNKSRETKSIPCSICGDMFKPVNRKYCSQNCAWKSQKGKPGHGKTPKHIAKFIRKTYPSMGPEPAMKKFNLTLNCVQNTAYRENVTLNNKIKFERQYKKTKQRMTGPTNPMWQEGCSFLIFGKNWDIQRTKALKRDNHTCQVCFEFGNVVHHIIPRRKFKIIEHSNVLSNLITLCNKHHVPVEIGKISCPVPKF